MFSSVQPKLVSQLQKSLHEHNKYIIDFKAAIDLVPKDQKEFKVVINADKKNHHVNIRVAIMLHKIKK